MKRKMKEHPMKNGIMRNFLFLGFLLLFQTQSPLAGEWGSAGGEFSKDLMNPWFVKNLNGNPKYEVRKILASLRTRTPSPPHLRRFVELFSKALSYWKSEFRNESTLGIAKQTFKKVLVTVKRTYVYSLGMALYQAIN